MRLILVRHYKTRFNENGQIMGWRDSPRADSWLEDLQFVEAQLRSEETSIDAILSSALGRARHTADYFAARLEIERVRVAPQLNEINYGQLSNRSKKWVHQHYPQHKKDPDFVYPEGESFRQMQKRSVEYVEAMARAARWRTVLCVIHAGVVRAMVSHYLELDFAQQLTRKVSHRYIGCLCFKEGQFASYSELGDRSGFAMAALPLSPYQERCCPGG